MTALQPPDKACCMPGRSTCQFLPLKQNVFGPTFFGKMISHRATMYTTADDGDLGMFR
jgi:hypothetical protein